MRCGAVRCGAERGGWVYGPGVGVQREGGGSGPAVSPRRGRESGVRCMCDACVRTWTKKMSSSRLILTLTLTPNPNPTLAHGRRR